MSTEYQPMAAPLVAAPPPDGYREECAWCAAAPGSCIACVECLEMFCSQECHIEYLEQEAADFRRVNACREAFQGSVADDRRPQ